MVRDSDFLPEPGINQMWENTLHKICDVQFLKRELIKIFIVLYKLFLGFQVKIIFSDNQQHKFVAFIGV